MTVKHISKSDFIQKVWNFEQLPREWNFLGDKPAIIDFFATWCGPCKMLSPVLEQLSIEYQDKLDIYKIDIDQEYELCELFNIRSVPTLLFCPKNKQPYELVGSQPKSILITEINNLITL
ncbi:MAG: thioredoxin [Bacteroidales bacterium]|nr:thioredoxin [Bacteroidales bacterium]